jgi:hypothetical protein
VLMEVAPPRGDLVGEVGDTVDNGHGFKRSGCGATLRHPKLQMNR